MSDDARATARTLGRLVEPIAAQVYFSSAAGRRYQDLGLGYFEGYFCSRSACMGKLQGEVVAATFGVFNPDIVVPLVQLGWSQTEPEPLLQARLDGSRESLEGHLGPDGADASAADVERATELLRQAAEGTTVAGRPIHAGLRSLGWPGDPLGDLWRAADLVREHRGDGHNVAWVDAGVSAPEISVLFELWLGLPLRSYSPTRGWTDEQLDPAIERLREDGLVDGDRLTDEGRAVREQIEQATDDGERHLVEALGDDAEELFALLRPWGEAIAAAGGYPTSPDKVVETVQNA